MKVAIITLDAFNELDSFIASAILNRVPLPEWSVQICCPTDQVTSMNGLVIQAQQPIEYANTADIVLFGSGMKTTLYADDPAFLKRLQLNGSKQVIGSQCSGALFLNRLGLLKNTISTDTMTAPHLKKAGLNISQTPLYAEGNIASAGGLSGILLFGGMDHCQNSQFTSCCRYHPLRRPSRTKRRICSINARCRDKRAIVTRLAYPPLNWQSFSLRFSGTCHVLHG